MKYNSYIYLLMTVVISVFIERLLQDLLSAGSCGHRR